MKRLAVLLVLAGAMVLPPGTGASASQAVHVVDDDRRQCASAKHTTIQSAVDAAGAGDLVRVCPGRYVERVVVDKPLAVRGQPGAVEAVDCFDPRPSSLDDLDLTRHAVVQAPPDTSPPQPDPDPLFRLDADGVELAWLVLQGAPRGTLPHDGSPAVITSDDHSGYRVHHNLIRLNDTLGIEFGSSGTHPSRVDHNCLRENRWGVANQRLSLTNARVDHNATTLHRFLAYEIGLPGEERRADNVVLDHNTSKDEGHSSFRLENTTNVSIIGNTIESARFSGVWVAGDTTGLQLVGNTIESARFYGVWVAGDTTGLQLVGNTIASAGSNGVRMVGVNTGLQLVDNTVTGSRFVGIVFLPSDQGTGVGVARGLVQGNTVTGNLHGIRTFPNATSDTGGVNLEITNNVLSGNRGSGLLMHTDNYRNEVRGNVVENNGADGISLRGAKSNVVEGNRMLGNQVLDARDEAVNENDWSNNNCVTSEPTWLCQPS